MVDPCKRCYNGHLGGVYGDLECVNGVLIDIDVFTEGYATDVAYPPAPCCACLECSGSGVRMNNEFDVTDDCSACNGTGWASGREESHDRLAAALCDPPRYWWTGIDEFCRRVLRWIVR